MNHSYSNRAALVQSSAIREILKITADPSIISFAGGLPAESSFPVGQMKQAFNSLDDQALVTTLQYSPTLGLAPLREWIAAYKSTADKTITADQVLIVSGSQQALDLIGKLYLNPHDGVLIERPTYLGAIQALSLFEPRFHAIDMLAKGGPLPSDERVQQSKLIYLQPNFHNPTGRMMTAAQRLAFVSFLEQHPHLVAIEDDPYGELFFAEPPSAAIASYSDQVIYMSSFSKILAPGLRLGYVIAPRPIIEKLEHMKQASDLHTSSLSQMLAYKTLVSFDFQAHVQGIRHHYGQKAALMDALLTRHLTNPAVTWRRPEGGMFIWLSLPDDWDARAILDVALRQKVAFIPGDVFYTEDHARSQIRLSFVTVPEAKLHEGVEILSRILNEWA